MERFQHVLIIDDDPITSSIILNLLKEKVTRIDAISDGNLATEKIKHGKYDLVFLDLNLPGKSGMEILDEIRDMPMLPRIVGISSTKERGKQTLFENRGLHHLLSKPLYSKEIFEAIQS